MKATISSEAALALRAASSLTNVPWRASGALLTSKHKQAKIDRAIAKKRKGRKRK